MAYVLIKGGRVIDPASQTDRPPRRRQARRTLRESNCGHRRVGGGPVGGRPASSSSPA